MCLLFIPAIYSLTKRMGSCWERRPMRGVGRSFQLYWWIWTVSMFQPGPPCGHFFFLLWLKYPKEQPQGEKIYLGSQLQNIQSMVIWSHVFGQNIRGWGDGKAVDLVNRKQRVREEWGTGWGWGICNHAANALLSSSKPHALKFPEHH